MSRQTKNKERAFRQDDCNSLFSILKKFFIFTMLFFLIFAVISVIFALIFFNTKNPVTKIDVLGAISLYISSLLSGFIIAKKSKAKKILNGIILGIVILLILFIISLCASKINWFKFLTPVFTFLGSLFGAKQINKKKKRYR